MDGKYLANNIVPLSSIANGRVLKVINMNLDKQNEHRANPGKLVAYVIRDFGKPITGVECLIETNYGLHFRNFSFFENTGTIDDHIEMTAKYGFGFHDVEMERFIKLREFYLEQTQAPAAQIS